MVVAADLLSESGTERTQIRVPGSRDAPEADLVTGFRNGFVFELLDIREPQPLAVHVMVLNPDRYELAEPHQSTLTPTADNTVVDESNGIIQGTLSLEGTFGVSPKRATGFEGAQGGGKALSGDDHFRALRDMFRTYGKLKQDPEANAFVRLIFHALKDDDHVILAKPVFTTPRDAKSTRMHYRYRIQADTIGDAASISKLRRSDAATSTGGFFSNATKAVAQAFNDARAAFAEVNEQLGVVRRKVGNINAVMVQAAGFINSVGNALSNGSDTLIAYPLQLAATATEQVADSADFLATSVEDATVGTAASLGRSLRRMEDAFDRILAFPEKFEGLRDRSLEAYRGERRLTQADFENREAGATIGSRVRVRLGSESESFRFGSYASVEAVRVTATDTIDSLASRFSVEPEIVVSLNDLRPPYIFPGGGPGVLQPGDTILMPVRSNLGDGGGGQPGGNYFDADDAIYGVDFALDLARLNRESRLDFRAPVAADAGDLEYARGLNNVIQGTAVTVWTERGSTVFLPNVGINRTIGRKGTAQHVVLAALNLRDAILADTRITGISESRIVLDGDVLTQEIVPVVSGRRGNTTIVLPFGTASGGS